MARRVAIAGATLVAVFLVTLAWRIGFAPSAVDTVFDVKSAPVESAPLCPWRDPEADLRTFFPGANRYELQVRILSGRRVELAKALRRPPSADENALHVYRIFREQALAGAILTRRVKGSHGAIELVLAVDATGHAQGVRLQRWREPPSIIGIVGDAKWLGAFSGRRAADLWELGGALSEVPSEARAPAQAIVEGVRSLLILLEMSDQTEARGSRGGHHH